MLGGNENWVGLCGVTDITNQCSEKVEYEDSDEWNIKMEKR